MPKRNLLLVFLTTVVCLLAWMARDRGLHGRRFGEVMAAIERRHLEPVDPESLFGAAMEGVFSKLDEHSAFVADDEREALDASLDQEFGGVGLELAIDYRDGGLVVDNKDAIHDAPGSTTPVAEPFSLCAGSVIAKRV